MCCDMWLLSFDVDLIALESSLECDFRFLVDEISPSRSDPWHAEEYDYEIMSRSVKV